MFAFFRSSRHVGQIVLLGAVGVAAGCSDAPPTEGSSSAVDELTMSDLPVKIEHITAGTFTQAIDHPRSPGDAIGTFAQRYWYTTEFANGPDSPVLFQFCGEIDCSKRWLDLLADSAKSLHASIVVLEHR